MNWFGRLLRRKQQESHLDQELRFHIEQRVPDFRRSGLDDAEARRKARQQFGGADQVKEDCRDARGTRWLEDLLQDLRYAARGLWHHPGFALVIVFSLALSIGGNTAIFSVLNAVLCRSVPVVQPEQLYGLDITESKFRAPQRFSYPLFEQMRGAAGDGIAAMSRVARMYSRLAGACEQDIARVQLGSGE
jgi:hypothetical protein